MDTEKSRFYLITFILCSLLLLLLFIYLIFGHTNPLNKPDTITPTPTTFFPSGGTYSGNLDISPKTVQNLPQAPEGGIDVESTPVQKSIDEITKIADDLPYTASFETTNHVNIDILISRYDLLPNKWTLLVQINNIDYNAPIDSGDYPIMKQAFREGVENVFVWLRSKNVDPANVIFSWGDRKVIQDRAIEWLK